MFMACSAALETNFHVDDLLDFPIEEEEDDDVESAPGSAVIPHATTGLLFAPPLSATSIQLNKEDAALNEELSYGLCIPPDELVHQLEWLSSFSEDNFFSGGDAKLLSPTPSSSRASSDFTQCKEAPVTSHRAKDDFHSESPVSVLEHGGRAYALNHHVQRASRIRKARTGGRVWSLDILKPILFENRLKGSYENTSLLVTSCTSAYSEPFRSFLQPDDSGRPHKKIKQGGMNDGTMDSALVRKCTHCLVQKTPQWRAGPLGPKTLCNACGVRYKSGRLVPEYRPAASPSFINEVHSNSHRRILEMRRVQEVESSVKLHKSKAERAHKMDLKREFCIGPLPTLEEHSYKDSKGSLLCDVSACKDDEVSRGSGITSPGLRGKEDDLLDDGSVLHEANTTCNETLLRDAPKSLLEKHMPENACICYIEAACEATSCDKDANADMCDLDKYLGHEVEARMPNDLEKDGVCVGD